MTYQVEIALGSLPLLREQGATEGRPLLMPETLRLTAPRLDLPNNPIAPDWTLAITAVETGDGFWSSRDALNNPLLGATCAIRWRATAGADWIASRWRLDNITRTPGDCSLSFVSPLRRLLAAPLLGAADVNLTAALNETDTTATTSPEDIPEGHYCIGDELISVDADGELTRGVAGTTAQAHEDGASFNEAYYYDGENPFDVVKDVLETAGGGDYIDDASWDLERDDYAPTSVVSGAECEPRSVGEFVREMMSAAQTILFFDPFGDDGAGRIHMRSLSPWTTISDTLSPDNIDDSSSPTVRRVRGKQLTRVTMDGARRNWLDDGTFQLRFSEIDALAEEEYDFKRELRLAPSWLNGDIDVVRAEAEFSARLLVSRYRDPPMLVDGVRVQSSTSDLRLGDVVSLDYGRLFKSQDGEDRSVSMQIIGTQPTPADDLTTLTLMRYRVLNESQTGVVEDVIVDEDTLNLNIYEHLARPGVAVTLKVLVKKNVTIGSASPDKPALRTGPLPAGSRITLELEQDAGVVGHGGRGAYPVGVNTRGLTFLSALDGGDAIHVETGTMTIDNGAGGFIGGGGGGGAGGRVTIIGNETIAAIQGSAGAGYNRYGAEHFFDEDIFHIGGPVATTPTRRSNGSNNIQLYLNVPASNAEAFRPYLYAGRGGGLGEDGSTMPTSRRTLHSIASRGGNQLNRSFTSPSDAGAAIVVSSGASVAYTQRGNIAGDAPE